MDGSIQFRGRVCWGGGWLLAVFFGGLFLVGCGEPEAESGDSGTVTNRVSAHSDWPLFRGDPQMQGVSPETVEPPLELLWTYEPAVEEGRRRPPIEASPVILDGTVYVGTQAAEFLAIDLETGEERWKFEAEGSITAPAAAHGDLVYFGDNYGFIYALKTENGEEVWRYETEGKIEGGVNLLHDYEGGTAVLVGSHDYFLYCLDAANGEVYWKEETGNYIVATPSVVGEGAERAVCFGGCDGLLYILPTSADGEEKKVEIGSYIANSVSVRDGIAYVAHNGGEILAIEQKSGEEVWRIATGTEYTASPAVDETNVYIAGPDKRLVAYDRVTGDEKWAFLARRSLDSSPVVSGNAIWQAGMDGRLYAVSREDGSELWQFEIGAQIKASPAISRGVLVVCGSDGVVYALR